jgi:tetratricopeptide (TPR) repeat protein
MTSTRSAGNARVEYPRTIRVAGRLANRLLGSIAVVTILIVHSGAPWGARAYAMQLTPVQKQEMKLHYEKATRAYDVQKYSEAVDEYQKAYEIGGDPAMLYNVAQSYRLADQPADALRFYRRYLQRSPNARNREDVERKIAEMEKVVEARRKAAAAAPPAAPEPVLVAAPLPRKAKPKPSSGSLRVAGIVVASLGGAGLVTAAITGKLARDKSDQVTKASMNHEIFDENVEANGKALNTVMIVSAIAGGALLVTGAVFILLSGGGASDERQASLSPAVSPMFGPGVMGAAATVRF